MEIKTGADLGQTLYMTRGAHAKHPQTGYIIELFVGKVEEIRISGKPDDLYVEYVIWTGCDGDYAAISSDHIEAALTKDDAVKWAREKWKEDWERPGPFRGVRMVKK